MEAMVQKADRQLEQGLDYDAHQTLKSAFNRFKSKSSFQEIIDMLHDSARKFIKLQSDSSIDFLILSLEFATNQHKNDYDYLKTIMQFVDILPPEISEPEINRFFNKLKSVVYSKHHELTEQMFNSAMSEYFMKVKKYDSSIYHSMINKDIESLSKSLDIVLKECYSNEKPTIALKLIFRALVATDLNFSNQIKELKILNDIESSFPEKAYKAFIEDLLNSISLKDKVLFTETNKKHEALLSRDEEFDFLIKKIEKKYFPNAVPDISGLISNAFGMFNNLFQNNTSNQNDNDSNTNLDVD
ncbi:MAG: hypothetical protein MHMPM18_000903 [Marteilia pararefringens]